MKQGIAALLIILLAGRSVLASEPAAQPSPDDSRPDEISLADLHDFIATNRGWVLDVRPTGSYDKGHIPGAISLPDTNFSAGYEQVRPRLEADKNRPVVVYCASEWCGGAEWVQARLRELGFVRVARFRAGWEGWQSAAPPGKK